VSIDDGACSTVDGGVTIGSTTTRGSPIARRSWRIIGRGRVPGSMRMFTVATAVPGSTLERKPASRIVGT
jgi:hypothetical protein